MLWFLYSLVVNFWLLLFWPLRALRSRRAAPRGAYLQLELRGAISELPRRTIWFAGTGSAMALDSLRRVLRRAAEDERVSGIVITLRQLRVGGATARSLRDALLEARQHGLRICMHLPYGGATRETYLASVAHQILLGPQSELAPLGYAVQAQYFKGALERLGVEPEIFARGRYKTAGETLTRSAMSEPQREQVSRLLDTFYSELVDALSQGRNVPAAVAEQWIHQGPWPARQAINQGLADDLTYDDQLPQKLAPGAGSGAPARLTSALSYGRRRSIAWRPWRRPPRIAVIELSGPILSHSAGGNLLPVITETEFAASIDCAKRDPSVRGVILYINSPGGSALASGRMLHRVQQLAQHKPVVSYIADVGASGGYLVALGANTIVAQPTSITGSIGVVAARMVIEPLLRRLGIAIETVKRGTRADLGSPARHLNDEERGAFERELDDAYLDFLTAVSAGRRRSVAEIEPLAGGRVYSGRDALDNGLVDRLGGVEEALEALRTQLGAGAERLLPVAFGSRRSTLREWVPRALGAAMQASNLGPLLSSATLALSLRQERIWFWCNVSETDLGRPL